MFTIFCWSWAAASATTRPNVLYHQRWICRVAGASFRPPGLTWEDSCWYSVISWIRTESCMKHLFNPNYRCRATYNVVLNQMASSVGLDLICFRLTKGLICNVLVWKFVLKRLPAFQHDEFFLACSSISTDSYTYLLFWIDFVNSNRLGYLQAGQYCIHPISGRLNPFNSAIL